MALTSVAATMRNRDERFSFLGDFRRYSAFYFKAFKYLVTIPFQPKVVLHDPQDVLRSTLGPDLEVLNYKTDTLVGVGDNYGSSIVKLSVDVKRDDDKVQTLQLVAKMPPYSEFQRQVYRCDVSVAKEIFLYERVVPEYRKLYAGEFDIVPRFYGARLAAVAGVDDGALILLENLKESGYAMEDRCKGLTMDHMKIAIPALAKFHAIGLAMKGKNPDFFSWMQDYAKPLDMPEEMSGTLVATVLKLIKDHAQLSQYYERARALNKPGPGKNCFLQTTLDPADPWSCLVHRDLWNNNVMFRVEGGKVDGFKIFDFQNYCFSSPMTDLLYFLLTSLQRDFKDFDEAVELYRCAARDVLMELECDASLLFEKASFDERMKADAESEFFHAILMAKTSEMRSMWEIVRPAGNEHFVRRLKRILEIYDSRAWF